MWPQWPLFGSGVLERGRDIGKSLCYATTFPLVFNSRSIQHLSELLHLINKMTKVSRFSIKFVCGLHSGAVYSKSWKEPSLSRGFQPLKIKCKLNHMHLKPLLWIKSLHPVSISDASVMYCIICIIFSPVMDRRYTSFCFCLHHFGLLFNLSCITIGFHNWLYQSCLLVRVKDETHLAEAWRFCAKTKAPVWAEEIQPQMITLCTTLIQIWLEHRAWWKTALKHFAPVSGCLVPNLVVKRKSDQIQSQVWCLARTLF